MVTFAPIAKMAHLKGGFCALLHRKRKKLTELLEKRRKKTIKLVEGHKKRNDCFCVHGRVAAVGQIRAADDFAVHVLEGMVQGFPEQNGNDSV